MHSRNEGEDPMSAEVTEVSEPIIVHQGRYRLWQKPDGGFHLVYQRDDKDEPDHFELPTILVKLAQGMADGTMSPMQFVSELIKLRGSM